MLKSRFVGFARPHLKRAVPDTIAGRRLRRRVGGVVAIAVTLLIGPYIGLQRFESAHSAPLPSQRETGFKRTVDAKSLLLPSSPLRSLDGGRSWLNSRPLRTEDLRGKVVLVNFWTYSCINSLRTLPYIRTWAEKYAASGLVVVGVHSPEFAFEKDIANVRGALASLDVRYPVVLDSDFGIWRAFGNRAWPAFYFIGADGRIRRQVFGEGDYVGSEKLIQRLLTEATHAPVGTSIDTIEGWGAQAEADVENLRSPETYIGYGKARGFDSPGGLRRDASSLYRSRPEIPLNMWSLAGSWTADVESATLENAGGAVSYRFHSRDLHMVLAPPVAGRVVRFRITVDGHPPGANHGADVDESGLGRVDEPRMYQLVRQRQPIADRTFQIEFLDPGVHAYAFTFG